MNDQTLAEAVAELVRKGICVRNGDMLELTEAGYRLVAEEAGWSAGEDDDGDACFVFEGGYHDYSYVATWRELCRGQGLVG